MSRLTTKKSSQHEKIAGYGLHYHANVALFKNVNDRMLMQCLIDLVRPQLTKSLDNTTILKSGKKISTISGVNYWHAFPSSIKRLESLGLVRKFRNGYSIACDEYVALVDLYESLDDAGKEAFLEEFEAQGIGVLQNRNIDFSEYRTKLVAMSGSSFKVEEPQSCETATFSDSDAENVAKPQYSEYCESPMLRNRNTESSIQQDNNIAVSQHFAQSIAETLRFFNTHEHIVTFDECINVEEPQYDLIEPLKSAYETGKVPKYVLNDYEKVLRFCNFGIAVLQLFTTKTLRFCNTVIIEDKEKKINEGSPLKKGSEREQKGKEEEEEDIHESIRKGFERLTNFELPSFDDELPDDENKKEGEDKEGFGTGKEEDEEYSQLVINRAERKMRERNPYRKKRFIQEDRFRDIIEYVPYEVKSPYQFFLYLFWWGIFDLYQEHYNPAKRINEDGEVDEESRDYCEWNEMLHAPLPQDEIYRVAQNAYEDLCGAVEQGKYVGGDEDNEWEATFAFKEFEDFIPYHTFQWKPCTMKDKSIPALVVAIDKFYDIETDDCYVAPARSRSTNKIRNAHSRKMTAAILKADESQLTPMEAAIKKFYDAFVVLSDDDNMVDQWKDGRGEVLEYCDKLPDHILKPWCIGLKGIGYNGLTSVMFDQYKPIDGLHRRPWPFSAEMVVEWNERNGYLDTVAHQAIKDDEDSETEEDI